MEMEGLSTLRNPVDINSIKCEPFFRIVNLMYKGTTDLKSDFTGTFVEYIRRKPNFLVKLSDASSFRKWLTEYQEATNMYCATNHVAMTKAWYKVMKSSGSEAL